MFNSQMSARRALGIGILVGITIGSFIILIQQENGLSIGNPIGLLESDYDGLIGNPGLEQDDPRLVSYIRQFYLIPLSGRPYALSLPKDNNMNNPSQFGAEIMQIFSKKKNGGFFIEAGANDGVYLSNTLQLEREYNWTGLLVEPNPFMLTRLLLRNRKAWVAPVCLSLESYPQKARFVHKYRTPLHNEQWHDGMGIIEHSAINPVPPQTQRDPKNYIYAGPVDCFPLYPLLLALNRTVVDYFSMDIEGVELRVLKSIPFHLLTIKVFSIESNLIPEGTAVLKDFMKSKGYNFLFDRLGVESFFVHKDFVQEFNIP